jgi:hypothetical protein
VNDAFQAIVIILAACVIAYWVDDGRIRVAALALLGALMFWRNHSKNSNSSSPVQNGNNSDSEISNEPTPPDTEAIDAEIADTDTRLDSIDDARPSGNVGAGLDLLDNADRRRAGRDSR